MRIKAKKAFTLVELLVVIAIIAILAVVGILIVAVYVGVFCAAYQYLKTCDDKDFAMHKQDLAKLTALNEDAKSEAVDEQSVADEQVAEDEAPVEDEPIADEAAVADEGPIADETPADDDAPAEDEAYIEGEAAQAETVEDEAACEEQLPVATINVENNDEKADIDALTVNHRYNFSFEARLALANDLARDAYASIAEFASEFKVKRARSRRKERIYLSRTSFAALFFRGKKLCIALRLDPNDEAYAKYKLEDVSDQASLSGTPAMMRITCKRGRRIFGVGKFFGRAISQLRADGEWRRCAHQVSARKAHRISRRAL